MECPKCEQSGLIEKKVKNRDIKLDICPECQGIWFDKGELESLRNIPDGRSAIPADARRLSFLCPRCHEGLYVFCYPRTMVVVEMCKRCGGIWLDDNEFKEIHWVHSTFKKDPKKRNLLVCPKCGHQQISSNECAKCGIIFSKYREAQDRKKLKENATQNAPLPVATSIKGRLLNFIDNSLEMLW